MDPEAVSNNVVNLDLVAVQGLPKRVLGAIDGSVIDIGPRTVDAATTGFQMVWLWCPETGLPLAVASGTAEIWASPKWAKSNHPTTKPGV